MPDKKKPLPSRAAAHITRTAGVCNEWCQHWRLYDRFLPAAFLSGVLCFLLYFVTVAAPIDFPSASLVKIDKSQSIRAVAVELKQRHIIRSVYLFEWVSMLYGADNESIAGEYFFAGPENIFTVGRRLAHGDYELIPVKVTIPEGMNSFQMATLLAQKIPDFDVQTFLDDAQSKEGYLFPDTYFFLPGEDPLLVISTLETNFKQRISEPNVSMALSRSGRPLSDIVTMASLLEKEASNPRDKQVIAGILWHRIALGMPLQVDAVFPYILGKNSFQLSRSDLKTESPYNTYTNKGLPPGPIANPGMTSILAAATPIESNYLYYLSDMQSQFHFCATYACQLANQKKYLK